MLVVLNKTISCIREYYIGVLCYICMVLLKSYFDSVHVIFISHVLQKCICENSFICLSIRTHLPVPVWLSRF
jgi:hypothetical protein